MKTMLALLMAGFSTASAASTGPDSLLTRVTGQTVTVTATRLERPAFETGRSTSVISFNGLAGPAQPAQALSTLPGFFISGARQSPGALQFSTLRGSSAAHQTILLDGVRLQDPTSPDFGMDLSELSLLGSGRLEVVRGSHSTLYGSQAIGGTIHMVSALPARGFHGGISAGSGAYGPESPEGSARMQLSWRGSRGFFADAALHQYRAAGFNAIADTLSPGSFRLPNENDGFRKGDLRLRAGLEARSAGIRVSVRRHAQRADLDDGAFQDDENHQSEVTRTMGSLHAFWLPAKDFKAVYNGSYQMFSRTILDPPSLRPGGTDNTDFRSRNTGSVFNHDLQLSWETDAIQAVAGFFQQDDAMNIRTDLLITGAFPYESHTTLSGVGPNARTSALFVHATAELQELLTGSRGFSIAGGARMNRHSMAGDRLTWDLNPQYRISDRISLFSSMSTGYNAPSLYRLYATDTDWQSGITRGNRRLRPEESRSFETGLKWRAGVSTGVEVSAYRTTVRNFVDYVYLWEGSIPVENLGFEAFRGDTYLNLGTQRNQGLEITVQHQQAGIGRVEAMVNLARSRLNVSSRGLDTVKSAGHHVQVYSGGRFLNQASADVPLMRRPSTAALTGVLDTGGRLSVQGEVHYVAARKDGVYNPLAGPFGAISGEALRPFTLINMSARWQVSTGLEAALHIENLMNARYTEVRGYRGRPRYAGLTFTAMF